MTINATMLWCLVFAGMLVAGCRKEAPVPASSIETNAPAADQPATTGIVPPSPRGPGPPPAAPAPAAIAEQTDPNATLAQLSNELQKYVMRTRSVPKNFEEFIAKSQVQAPAPPVGKKYAIQDKAVV